MEPVRHAYALSVGYPVWPFGCDGALKIGNRAGLMVFDRSLDGEGIGNLAFDLVIIRTGHWLAGYPVLSLMVELSSANRAISIG